jgi:predicted PurR-regulated permease PerM
LVCRGIFLALLSKMMARRTRVAGNEATGSKAIALPMDGRARQVSRATLAIALVILSLWMAYDFLVPVGWAILIAVTTWPIYIRFANFVPGSRSQVYAPLLFTLLTGLALFLPVAIAAHRATYEGQAISQSINKYRENGIPQPEWLSRVPTIGDQAANWWRDNLSDAKFVSEWIGAADSKKDAAVTRALGSEVLHRFLLFVISLISLFTLLRHGAWVANRFLDTADRLLGDPGERLASKMVDAIRGTVNGTMSVAAIEGALIGVAYFLASVPNALLFTLLTMAFAILPFGAWAVFSTASLLMVLQGGDPMAAAGVFGFGAVVMLIGDTFIWPSLVGSAARLPFLLALIGIFGGLQVFGLIGLFLGPVLMTALLTVWREWLIAK